MPDDACHFDIEKCCGTQPTASTGIKALRRRRRMVSVTISTPTDASMTTGLTRARRLRAARRAVRQRRGIRSSAPGRRRSRRAWRGKPRRSSPRPGWRGRLAKEGPRRGVPRVFQSRAGRPSVAALRIQHGPCPAEHSRESISLAGGARPASLSAPVAWLRVDRRPSRPARWRRLR